MFVGHHVHERLQQHERHDCQQERYKHKLELNENDTEHGQGDPVGSFVDVRGVNALITESMARGMRTYS
jgi:hypothetical protein